MRQLLLIIGIIAVISACQPTVENEISLEERQEISSTIKQEFNAMMGGIKHMDKEIFDDWMNYFVENNDEAWMDNPSLWLNMLYHYPTKDDIIKVWKPEGDETWGQNTLIEEEYVAVLSREYAVYVFKGTYASIDNEGVEGENTPMSGSYVFALRDGKWKILHIHQSWKTD